VQCSTLAERTFDHLTETLARLHEGWGVVPTRQGAADGRDVGRIGRTGVPNQVGAH
jgi:hypothetical protein